MKYVKFILIGLLIFSGVLFAQNDGPAIIAKVGSKIITAKEFKSRFELVPQVSEKNKSTEMRKHELLYTIIAEKLWALEAEHLGLDTSDIMKMNFVNLEKMYLRDELYKQDIESRVKINVEQLNKIFNMARTTLHLAYIFSNDSTEINEIYSAMSGGVPFDSLWQYRHERKFQDTLYTVIYGQLSEDVEDELFSLSINQYSTPIKALNGWYIFKLVMMETKQYKDENELKIEYEKIRKELEQKVADGIYNEYFNYFFGNKKVNTNGYIFWSVAENIIEVLGEKKVKDKIHAGEIIRLDAGDFLKIENSLSTDTLNAIFIQGETLKITLRQFLRAFAFEGFYSNTVNSDTVRAKLQSRVKRFIEHELLADEADKRGLKNLPDVKIEIEMWKSNYLSKILNSTFIDSANVSETEARKQFDLMNEFSSSLVNVIEILTDSLEIVERIFSELESGTDFTSLVRKFNKRAETKSSDGEYGYFPVYENGEIGNAAAGMEIGDVYGPIETADGYSIIKLIGKKEPPKIGIRSFEEVKNDFIRKLKTEKMKNFKIRKTVEFANKYGVKIDHSVLKSINVKNLSMFVIKNFGFGGQMTAFPVTPIFVEWVEDWQKSKTALP